MSSHFRRVSALLRRSLRWTALVVVSLASARDVHAAEAVPLAAFAQSGNRVTNFEQIWRLAGQPEGNARHRVRLEFVVYYYDPLWKAMWGRCGDADSYLSLGNAVFPIKPGQRLLIEGFLVPAKGMTVEEPQVSVLAEAAPIEVLPTRGDVGNIARFNKRVVTLEGFVERLDSRDTNHVELTILSEGRTVVGQLLLKGDAATPAVRGAIVKVQGVYFARHEIPDGPPKLEVWVQSPDDVQVLGWLDRAERFNVPATPIAELERAPRDAWVRIAGTVQMQEPGKSIALRDATGEITLQTPQTRRMEFGAKVEAIGRVAREGGNWALREVLYRPARTVFTTLADVWQLPESQRQEVHRIDLTLDIYYHDPRWKVLWAREGDTDQYLTVGELPVTLKPGQRVRLEGSLVPAEGPAVGEPKVTVLGRSPAIEPVSTAGRIGDVAFFDRRLVVVEGYVDRQGISDAAHAEIDLVVEDRPVSVRVLVEQPLPQMEGTLLRAVGVYSATNDPVAQLPNIEIWVQGTEQTEVLGRLEDDPRFQQPVTPIEKLPTATRGAAVRIVGYARGQQPGKSLIIRDETGQTILHTAQSGPVPLGDRVEAIGVPTQEGAEWVLRQGLYRRAPAAPAAATAELPRLRLAEQLRELQPAEAAQAYPVQLSGIVTWASPRADFFFVHDISGGVQVLKPADQTADFVVGTRVDITGVSAAGKFTPVVLASRIDKFATVDLPEAKEVTLEHALTGVEDAQWVSMRGYVREMKERGPWVQLELTTAGGEFTLLVPPSQRLPDHRGAVVRMRGVCSAVANDKRQLTGIEVWVPSRHYIEVEEAAPEDPFAVPARSIASLRQFGSLQASHRRVRVSGVVLSHVPGRFIHLQDGDGSEGLLVLSRSTAPLAPGDRIEAVGFPGRETRRLVLREAVYRATGKEAQPKPLELGGAVGIDEEIDGRLVHVAATLLQTGAHERGVRLIAQANHLVFEALLDSAGEDVLENWVPGSRVGLTGVYEVQFDEYKRAHAVELRLRAPSDVRVLSRPSWWTARRALAATGVLAVGSLLGLGWVVALRRRVRQQTEQIRAQLESEKAARLEAALARASKLESLGVLAGGIAHDFNNLLTVVMCNLSLAKLDTRLEPETGDCLRESERAAARARDLTQQLLTFAKGGAPVRTAIMLPDVVRESAAFALHGAKSRSDFDIARDLWAADVDKGQVGQVVHNIVINANQAMPAGGVIRIALHNAEVGAGQVPPLSAGRYVKLTISDQGGGIAPADLPRIFDPYFTTKQQGSGLGLATVYSVVKQHQGHIEVESTVGVGTTFHIWLPAAERVPVKPAAPCAAMPQLSGRVLFMDDEPSIRIMASAVLKRMGLETLAVSDGAAVVREYATALANGQPFDLVILDLTVPGGMGGAEAMEKLREMDMSVRAIVSSGYSSDPVLANYHAYGFCGIVPKPYEATDLARAVEAVLKNEKLAV